MDNDPTVIGTKADIENLEKIYASLIILHGDGIGTQFDIRRNDLNIGLSSDADVMVSDKRISRFHAKIKVIYDHDRKQSLYELLDLDSTNHVYVNGKQTRDHLLHDGDKIQVGDTILKFVIQDKIEAKFHLDIQRKIEYDDLTSLLTYESFKTAVCRELETSRDKNSRNSLLMMDIDDFKKVNDTYGHLTGSYILEKMGSIIKNNIRQFDVPARYGGEEFITCLPDTSKHEAFHSAERLRKNIAGHDFIYNNTEVKITVSIGISQFPENGLTLEELVNSADYMLYKAKKEGKNRVYITD